jgi:hypothetical protein
MEKILGKSSEEKGKSSEENDSFKYIYVPSQKDPRYDEIERCTTTIRHDYDSLERRIDARVIIKQLEMDHLKNILNYSLRILPKRDIRECLVTTPRYNESWLAGVKSQVHMKLVCSRLPDSYIIIDYKPDDTNTLMTNIRSQPASMLSELCDTTIEVVTIGCAPKPPYVASREELAKIEVEKEKIDIILRKERQQEKWIITVASSSVVAILGGLVYLAMSTMK